MQGAYGTGVSGLDIFCTACNPIRGRCEALVCDKAIFMARLGGPPGCPGQGVQG